MNFKNIVVAGGGVLGSQIAYQVAFKGFDVTMWLRSEGSIERTKPKLERLHKLYLEDLEAVKGMIGNLQARYSRGLIEDFENINVEKIDRLKKKADDAYKDIKIVLDLEDAVKDADLIIECVAEIPDEKKSFYTKLSKVLPEKTVLVTNSSTMLPSTFAEYTGRPEKFLALHFANNIWKNNTAEIMGHDKTGKDIYNQIVVFAEQIGMVPLKLYKEQPGYILNSLLVPFLGAAEALWANDVADPETIDMTWMLGTGAPAGPFRILDVIGLQTAYNVVMNKPEAQNDPNSVQAKIAKKLKEYIDEGKTGINAGEGFYKYK